MSDLQCAATLVLAARAETDGDAGLSRSGRDRARELGAALSGRRVAMVYAGTGPGCVQTAELVAGAVGVPVRLLPGLDDEYDGRVHGVRRGPQDVLGPVADLHRGETVVVVCEGHTITDGLPPLVGPRAARDTLSAVGPCSVVEVEVDADGWVIGSATPHAG